MITPDLNECARQEPKKIAIFIARRCLYRAFASPVSNHSQLFS
jgi:hypothetical protein